MFRLLPSLVYILCFGASASCLLLLWRGYLRSKSRFLLWSALCFVGLTINNLLLFLDLSVLPTVDLRLLRGVSALGAIAVLLYGFIWESE
ncbi:MAG TPA: DUF5985 family protein [Alphaproteobacteria bacterium]|nr:DUF5985 family protein [Alphaproteobacteria bacterium]